MIQTPGPETRPTPKFTLARYLGTGRAVIGRWAWLVNTLLLNHGLQYATERLCLNKHTPDMLRIQAIDLGANDQITDRGASEAAIQSEPPSMAR